MKTVSARASFDLSCPRDELVLTTLTTSGPRQLTSQIGVTGCGNKAVYVYFASSNTWVADSDITPAMTSREQAYEAKNARADQAAEDEWRFEQQQSYQRGTSE